MSIHAVRPKNFVALLALSLTGLLACKETSVDEFIDKTSKDVCEAVIACDCKYPNGASLDHCIGQLTVNFDSLAQVNLVEGLSFDGDCADQSAADLKDLACGVAVSDPDAECEAPCKVFHGPVGKGGTCTTINGNDNCKQGLVCDGDGVCVNPCAKPDLPAIDEVCGALLGCAEGAYCDLDVLTPVCVALPAVGMPCTDDSRCDESLLCNGEKTCVALPGLGVECVEFQCARDLYCDVTMSPGVCAAVPKLGEPCPLGACAAPLVCGTGSKLCQEPPPQICGSYGGLPQADCEANQFTCNDGACIGIGLACDGMAQCDDGSDEAPINGNCGAGCAVDEFTCLDGSCVDLGAQCDNNVDCPDGSDELPGNPLCV